MSAWAFKYYATRDEHSPLMELMQTKLHRLTAEQIAALADEIGVARVTLRTWRSGSVWHGSGLIMSLLCQHFGIIKAPIPEISEEEQIALEVRYKSKLRRAKNKKNPDIKAGVRRSKMRVVR